jgi:hypothetical protein
MRRSLLHAAILCVFAFDVVSVARLLLIYEQTFAPPIEPAFIRLRGLWLAHLRGKICAGNLRANRSHRVHNFTMNATYTIYQLRGLESGFESHACMPCTLYFAQGLALFGRGLRRKRLHVPVAASAFDSTQHAPSLGRLQK